MATHAILTLGFGVFGDVNLIPTLGFESGAAVVLGTRFPDPSRSVIRVLADEPGTYASRIRVLPATPDSSRVRQL